MADHLTTTPHRGRPAATALGLLVAGALGLALAVVLALWLSAELSSTRLWRVEDVVAPVVVAVGALAAGWVGTSCLVAGVCAAARTVGGVWRTGEAMVHRWAPGMVRKGLAVAVAAAVGLGTAAGAHAAVAPAPAPPAAAVTVDLGWTPTGTPQAPTSAEDVTVAPASTASEAPDGPAPGEPSAEAAAPSPGARPTAPPLPAAEERDAVQLAASPVSADLTALPAVAAATDPEPTTLADPVVHRRDLPAAAAPAAGGTVLVQEGDTLWGLAARALGPAASDAQIAAEWPRWYAANASVIGADPDVLVPGQVLVVPTTDGGAR